MVEITPSSVYTSEVGDLSTVCLLGASFTRTEWQRTLTLKELGRYDKEPTKGENGNLEGPKKDSRGDSQGHLKDSPRNAECRVKSNPRTPQGVFNECLRESQGVVQVSFQGSRGLQGECGGFSLEDDVPRISTN